MKSLSFCLLLLCCLATSAIAQGGIQPRGDRLDRLAKERATFQDSEPKENLGYELMSSPTYYYPVGKGLVRYVRGWSRRSNSDVLVKQSLRRGRVRHDWVLPLKRAESPRRKTGTLNYALFKSGLDYSVAVSPQQKWELESATPLAAYFIIGPISELKYYLLRDGHAPAMTHPEVERLERADSGDQKLKTRYPIPREEIALLERGASIQSGRQKLPSPSHASMATTKAVLLSIVALPSPRVFEAAITDRSYRGATREHFDELLTERLQPFKRFSLDSIQGAIGVVADARGGNAATDRLLMEVFPANSRFRGPAQLRGLVFDLSDRASLLTRVLFPCDARERVSSDAPYFHRWTVLSLKDGSVNRRYPLVQKGSRWSFDASLRGWGGSGSSYGPLEEFKYYRSKYPRTWK